MHKKIAEMTEMDQNLTWKINLQSVAIPKT